MVRVGVVDKTVWSPCYYGPHLSALVDGSSHIRRCTNVYYFTYFVLEMIAVVCRQMCAASGLKQVLAGSSSSAGTTTMNSATVYSSCMAAVKATWISSRQKKNVFASVRSMVTFFPESLACTLRSADSALLTSRRFMIMTVISCHIISYVNL